MTNAPTPQRVRTYRHHHLESLRWDGFRPRQGDVVISTSIKAGTTWMQRIMSLLVFGPEPLPTTLFQLSPWIDCRFVEPIDVVLERIEAQDHQRFFKSHLPLDALPWYPEVRYIYVGRDTRDVFMSLWNHYRSYNEFMYERFAETDPDGERLPRCPSDPRVLWRDWITRPWFEWERDGWPFWSHHYHAESFWEWRHLPNVLLVHYNSLKADLEHEMRRVAAHAGIAVDDEMWPALVDAASFESMKRDADVLVPETALGFEGGPSTFIYKGTNDRWRNVLTPEDLERYERRAESLDPALRTWLETGRLATTP
jgi:aryl sulfotransferase